MSTDIHGLDHVSQPRDWSLALRCDEALSPPRSDRTQCQLLARLRIMVITYYQLCAIVIIYYNKVRQDEDNIRQNANVFVSIEERV